ncbi:MAG TPA: B12-binding domain-containing radical SAM protein [Candidatus Blackburnbacteria bacterium]|nr:B12-binding domain-containing radical SAM protein [Candidatus Blackburnbacteria bacterium]
MRVNTISTCTGFVIMEKILFVIPPYVSFDSFVNPAFNDGTTTKKSGKYRNIVADFPMGVLSLSAYLKKNANVEVKLIDFNIVLNKLESFEYKSFSELFNDILSSKKYVEFVPTIIGISTLFTPAYYNMLDIAKVCKKLFSNSLIVAGGGVPTNMYREIFKVSKSFDALCFGEGEKPMLDLIQTKNKYLHINNNPSWITYKKIRTKKSFRHNFIIDLDEIPFFDLDIIKIDDYRLTSVLSTFPLAKERMKGMSFMTSRGCVHRCCFCASHSVHGRQMRFHSIVRIENDLRKLKRDYGIKLVVFFDDHFMANRERVFKIVNIMKNLQLTAFFPASLTLYALDRKMLEALKSIGLNELVLSVESGSDKVLREVMHKPLNLSIVKRVIKDCQELGIDTDVAILIGLPGETKKDIEDTRSFLKTLNATWFRINIATPLAGSEMLEICLRKNYLKGDYISCDFKRPVIGTEDFTPEYIQEKAYALNLELNFVENSDFKLGNYKKALRGFENTIRVKNDHAFAYYFAARCCKSLKQNKKYMEYKNNYKKIIKDSEFWRNYFRQFNLEPLRYDLTYLN